MAVFRMKRIGVRPGLLFALACGYSLIGTAKARPQTTSQDQLQTLIYSLKGPDLFHAYCASCHGLDAKGNGPVAGSLKTKVPDLTVLARNNKGVFPADRVRKIIAGDDLSLPAHGTRTMPVWGPVFHQIERDQDFGNVRLQNLSLYLQSIQRK